MRIKLILNSRLHLGSLVILGIVLCPAAAWANNPPDPITFASVALILPVLAACMALGGAFAILAAQKPVRSNIRALKIGALAVLIILSMITESCSGFVWLISLFIVFKNSREMVKWGNEARQPPEQRKPSLRDAKPKRLYAASVVAIVLTLFFTDVFISFIGHSPTRVKLANPHELQSFINFQFEHARRSEKETGIATYLEPETWESSQRWVSILSFTDDNPLFIFNNSRVDLWFAPDRRAFKIWIWPDSFPIWPYNKLISLPSFFADQTGQIRMIKVHRPQKCPEDAPIIETISP